MDHLRWEQETMRRRDIIRSVEAAKLGEIALDAKRRKWPARTTLMFYRLMGWIRKGRQKGYNERVERANNARSIPQFEHH
jgi:hypothetical protein